MGLGVAIAGSISVAVVFMVITVIPGTSDKLVDYIDAKSDIEKIDIVLEKTNFIIETIDGSSGSDKFNFVVSNQGTEKLWNFEEFDVIVEYDADVTGTKTRTIEQLVYNSTASFPQLTSSQFARPDQDISTGGWVALPLYEKIDEVSPNDSDFVWENPLLGVTDTGRRNATATGEDHNQWVTPDFAFSSNNLHASSGTTGNRQDWYNFGFALPADTTVLGIEVRVEGHRQVVNAGYRIELSWNGGTTYTTTGNQFTFTNGTDTIITHGSQVDTWGRSWTQDELSNSNFRLRLEKIGGLGGIVNVDNINVKIHSTDPQGHSQAEVGLSSITEPPSSLGHIVKFRENGKLNRNLNVTIIEGTNLIATRNFDSENSFITREFKLTPVEANSISDYSDLRLRWNYTDIGGSGVTDVSWAELEFLGIPAFQGSISEWGINGVEDDVMDPRIINSGEFFELGGKLQYPIYSGGMLKVTVSADNGKSTSNMIIVS